MIHLQIFVPYSESEYWKEPIKFKIFPKSDSTFSPETQSKPLSILACNNAFQYVSLLAYILAF